MVIATRPVFWPMISARLLATSRSEGERPSRMALVESQISASTPSSPIASSRGPSVLGGSTGVSSIFQSPVWMTVPAGVRMASAFDSGIEWATSISSMSNGPRVKRARDGMTLRSIFGAPGSLQALGLEQSGGELGGVDGHAELRPQMDQRAEMILMRVGEDDAEETLRSASMKRVSGMTRSMPGRSSPAKETPQSTISHWRFFGGP